MTGEVQREEAVAAASENPPTELPAREISRGQIYQHYKRHTVYLVTSVGFMNDSSYGLLDGKEVITYMEVEPPKEEGEFILKVIEASKVWHRFKDEFLETVRRGPSDYCYRFNLVGQADI